MRLLVNVPIPPRMFDLLSWLYGSVTDPTIGAVGSFHNECSAPVHSQCGRVDMFHQGQISVAKSPTFNGENIKTLQPVQLESHTQPQFLSAVGPSVTNDLTRGKVFSFTARVDPDSAVVDGVRIDWSAPPDSARVLVSPSERGDLHPATGWIPTKSDARFQGGVPQSQNVIFSHPEMVKRIEIQMRDAPASVKTQFGIDQVSLMTNGKDQVINS